MDCKEYSIINQENLSYIERLLPELKGCTIQLLQKTVPSFNSPPHQLIQSAIEQTQHELTGSPLEYNTMNEESFNVTLVTGKKLWRKNEENHMALKKEHVPGIITEHLDKTHENRDIPILGICDCKDKKGTIILGSYVRLNWFENVKVDVLGLMEIAEIEKEISLLLKTHSKMSGVKEHEVIISASCEYELFGTKSEYIHWNDSLRFNFEGNLTINSKWNSLSFNPDLKTSENNLFIEAAINWRESLLKEFWDQQLLLNSYLTILEKYYADLKTSSNSRFVCIPLEFPDSFSTPFLKSDENLIENLEVLIKGKYYSNSTLDFSFVNITKNENENVNMQLKHILKDLSTRENLDFTDYLWNVLRGSSNYTNILNAVDNILDEFTENDCNSQMNTRNPTRFSRFLKSPHDEYKKITPNEPLEFLIDMGIEKLHGDYMYLLRSINFLNLQELKEKLKNVSDGKFSINNYREKLLSMAQITVCLELALLVESHLDYSMSNLQQLFRNAFKKYCSESSVSFTNIREHSIYNLTITPPAVIIKEIITRLPFIYRVEFMSSNEICKLKNVRHYSILPIFPPNIYSDTKTGEYCETTIKKQMYYGTHVICTSFKTNFPCKS